MSEIKYSKYQEAIFDWVQNGKGNAVVQAVAGSGKTFTIVEAVKLIPEDSKVLFLAFNNSIVKELQTKIKGDNIHVKTSHSLGFSLLKEHFKDIKVQLNEYKYSNFFKKNFLELAQYSNLKTKKDISDFKENILDLLDLARVYLCASEEDIEALADKYDYCFISNEAEIILRLIAWGVENCEEVDFTDMISLPNYLDLKTKKYRYDFVLLDECQDQSIAMQLLFKRVIKKGGRWIAVGDGSQCQPAGTKILLSNGNEKNIEDIKIGDRVVTYDARDKSSFMNYMPKEHNLKYACKVLDTANRYVDKTIKIKTMDGKESEYSFNHICYAKINKEHAYKTYILYLTSNNKGMWRIGITQLFKYTNSKHTFGLKGRMSGERCNKGWILKMYDNYVDAKMDESLYSLMFQIPQITFRCDDRKIVISDKHVEQFFVDINLFGNLNDRAKNCLEYFNKDINYPFSESNKRNHRSKEHIFEIEACNLFPKYMDVGIFNPQNIQYRTHGKNKRKYERIRIEYSQITDLNVINETKKVYSLDVERRHNYVADGILTHNCINSFAGSDLESYDKLTKEPYTITLPLSICYRCPKVIEPIAQKYVPNFEVKENAIEGKVNHDLKVDDIIDGSMVLCRNTAPLISLYMKLLAKNKKAFVKGRDIGNNMIKMIEKTEKLELNVNLKADGVFVQLYKRLFETRDKLMLKKGLDYAEASVHDATMYIHDVIDALKVLSEGLKTSLELIQRINYVFSDTNTGDGITLSTIHKSKGLEAEHIYILCPSLIPSKYAFKDWEIQSEKNLQYVMYTRTKNTLNFISEKDFSPSIAYNDVDAVLSTLRVIEPIVFNILNPEQQFTQVANNELYKISSDVKNIEETEKPALKVTTDDVDQSEKFAEIYAKKKKRFEKLLLGLTWEDALDTMNDLNLSNDIRVVKEDNKNYIITCDFKPDRLNITLVDKFITDIEFG